MWLLDFLGFGLVVDGGICIFYDFFSGFCMWVLDFLGFGLVGRRGILLLVFSYRLRCEVIFYDLFCGFLYVGS